ncbi:MAG: putative hydroxymethylpyrimidine transport system ATP-binding protein [Desulforhopalus sp.]|jgi:putative hydroxymethylpyrimidine transport system ATP-binding protein
MSVIIPSQIRVGGVSCRNIDVSYDNKPLFEDFSLDFEEGRCTCLLGPSGCGKSTLIRIISGAKNISYQGKVSFNGDDHRTESVAWMSQKDLLLPWMTVIDNIMLGAKLRGELSQELHGRAQKMLSDAGLADYGKKYPSVLSGGMRQRVALLRTLMEKRPVILMDEPFSALDTLTRLKLQDLAAGLTRGKTVILVTHDPMEALRLGDRIVVLGGSPAAIVADIRPGGSVPRESGGAVLACEYPHLLKTLMGEAVV